MVLSEAAVTAHPQHKRESSLRNASNSGRPFFPLSEIVKKVMHRH